jgi:lipopolysaccharide export system protein LptC
VRRFLLSSLLASPLGLIAACGPRPDAAATNEEAPQVVLRGVQLQSFEGDQLTLAGKAERLTYQRSEGAVTATNALLRMPSRRDTPAAAPSFAPRGGLEIRAPVMEGSLASRQLVASGGVVIRTSDGMVARTPRGTFDAAAKTVRGREGVVIQGPDYAQRADRFELSFPEGTFTFEGSAETVVGGAK